MKRWMAASTMLALVVREAGLERGMVAVVVSV